MANEVVYTESAWDALLEDRMRALTAEIDALVTADIRHREHSLIRGYLYRARYALVDGVGWYEFFRKKHGDLPDYPRKLTPKGGV